MIQTSNDSPATRLATRIAFLVAGFGIACWAPLIPFAKGRLLVDDKTIGLLLLCLGVGSVAAMSLTGILSARYGSRPIIIASGLGLAVFLPVLSVVTTPLTLGLALALFGASLGLLDVAMNIHAVEVEHAADKPLMSGFHALYSVGGFLGSSAMTALLSFKIGPLAGTLICSAVMIVAMLFTAPRLLRGSRGAAGSLSLIPRGIVVLLAVLAAAIFLAEGAVLDWSALLLTSAGLVTVARGGLGYMLFSIAMTCGRFTGDAVVARVGDYATLFWGGSLAMLGFVGVALAPNASLAMVGFVCIGLGASNIVPILFRRAGSQTAMPVGLAISAVTTLGYAGILLGPGALGYIANYAGLPAAFLMLAGLLCLFPITARVVAKQGQRSQGRN